MSLQPGDQVWVPDRASEARVEQEVAPRSFELVTDGGVSVRRNQRSVRRLPPKPPEQSTSESTPEDHTPDDSGSDKQATSEPATPTPGEPNTPETSAHERAQPTEQQETRRTSMRVRKPRDLWEPRWSKK